MSFMPPSNEQLKREIALSTLEEGNLNELLIKEKDLKMELKELQKLIKERKDVITEIMVENEITDAPLSEEYNMKIVRGGTRLKVMSGKDIIKKYPHLPIDYPDLITEVKSKDQMRIEVRK